MCKQGPTCTGIKLKTIVSQMVKNIHDAPGVGIQSKNLDDVRGEFCGEFHMYMRFYTSCGANKTGRETSVRIFGESSESRKI